MHSFELKFSVHSFVQEFSVPSFHQEFSVHLCQCALFTLVCSPQTQPSECTQDTGCTEQEVGAVIFTDMCTLYLEVNCAPCSALVCAPFSDMFTVQCCCSHHAKSQLAAVQCSAQRGALKASHLEWVLLIQRFNCAPCYTMHLHFCPHPNLPITLQPSPGATFQTQAALLCAALSCFVVFLGG